MSEIKLGQVFKDNDPRMPGRRVIVTGTTATGGVVYRQLLRNGERGSFAFKGLARRFYFDGKPRKSGFSLVVEAPPKLPVRE